MIRVTKIKLPFLKKLIVVVSLKKMCNTNLYSPCIYNYNYGATFELTAHGKACLLPQPTHDGKHYTLK